MVDRSDKTTARARQDVFFSDLMNDFKKHPNSGNLVRAVNEVAIKQALKNVILTGMGERLYQPLIGGDIRNCLFEPVDVFTSNRLSDAIVRTIQNNLPMVEQMQVNAAPTFDELGYEVSVVFKIFNNAETFNFELTLTRIR